MVTLNEDILQQNNEKLTLAEEKRGSAEHMIQAQKDVIERLQKDIAVVSNRVLYN